MSALLQIADIVGEGGWLTFSGAFREREVMLMDKKRWANVLRFLAKVLVIVMIIILMALLLAPKAC